MLFNSYEYILLLLPASLLVYYILNGRKLTVASRWWLVIVSLFFYGWWDIRYVPLILASILFNFTVGFTLASEHLKSWKKAILSCGVFANLLLLGYYKYADFFLTNLDAITGTNHALLHLALPLGISFFTFTQIAFLVDSYKGIVKEFDIVNYALFVTFFPHLIAGPIIHHKEMMPQFKALRNKVLNYRNISKGIFIFSVGVFKKVALADYFAQWANYGFDNTESLALFSAWFTALSYTFQIYFDFSGYTDMAIGSALLFNILLPINFNSPYRAIGIQDFWRRWHITLSRFLRDYVYIPLGGNRRGDGRTYFNLVAVFFLGGLWHGAGWTFIIWGLLHGVALVVERAFSKSRVAIPTPIAWLITFIFICITWVFFRATELRDAVNMLKAMAGINGYALPAAIAISPGAVNVPTLNVLTVTLMAFSFIVVLFFKNSNLYIKDFRPNARYLCIGACLMSYSLLSMNKISEFLYFNF